HQALVMAPQVLAETVACDGALELGPADGLEDGGSPQRSRELQEAVEVAGRRLIMPAAETNDPAIAFDGLQQDTSAARRGVAESQDGLPVVGRVPGNLEHARRIAEIDPDGRFPGVGMACCRQ